MIIGDWVADLHILVEFARSKNMVEAAERLKMSQGAVSIRLKGLAAKVEQPIFEMVGKKKMLTAFGSELARLAHENFTRFDKELREVTHHYANASSIPIRIACRKEIMDRLVNMFKIENPLIFSDMNHNQIVEALINRNIDLGITHSVPNSNELIAKKIFTSHVVICAHKKLQPEFHNPEWLERTPVITYKIKDPPYVDPFLTYHGLTINSLRLAGTCESWPAIRMMVMEGKGWALVPANFGDANAQIKSEAVDRSILPEQTFFMIFRKASALRKILTQLKI
jgi:DNA-binding transcriptional LysR family regulator